MGILVGKIKDCNIDVLQIDEIKRYYKDENGEDHLFIISIEAQLEKLKNEGWKEIEEIDESQMKCEEEFYSISTIPIERENSIGLKYEKRFDKKLAQRRINELKKQLSDSDYKIIKCYEASLLNEQNPYDIETMHAERQAIRDEINRIENIINQQS